MIKLLIEGPVQRLCAAAWDRRADDCQSASDEVAVVMRALLKEVRDGG